MASLLWTYLLSLSTFGIYVLVWVYRTARERGQRRSEALVWALGYLAAPFACLILYDFARRTGGAGDPGPRTPWAALVAPVLHASIATMLLLSPLNYIWSAVWVLLPLPILIVARQLRSTRPIETGVVGSAGAASTVRRGIEIAVVVIGAPLVAWSSLTLDRTALQLVSSDDGGTIVQGSRAAYALRIGSPAWRQVDVGTLGDESSDLELASLDQQSWVINYVHEASASIDSVVDFRRRLIDAEETLTGLEERKYFMDDADLAPVSFARYAVGGSALNRAVYLVQTARIGDQIVEVIGYTQNPSANEGRLHELVMSLHPAPSPPDDRGEEP